MAKRARRQFTPEYKAEAVSLVRSSGKTLPQVARDLDLTESSLRNWVQHAHSGGDAGNELSLTERQELQQLRKENRVLRMERELLKKAAAFFAKEPT
jgi:transposase